MDTAKPPGIAINQISLMESHISVNMDVLGSEDFSKLRHNLQLTEFVRIPIEAEQLLLVYCGFDLMHDIDPAPFTFEAKFVAEYGVMGENPNMQWNEFTDIMATAHVIPFLREFITNMTTRLPYPALIIPPINVAILLGDYHARREAAQETSGQE